jgi:hypothetical protein
MELLKMIFRIGLLPRLSIGTIVLISNLQFAQSSTAEQTRQTEFETRLSNILSFEESNSVEVQVAVYSCRIERRLILTRSCQAIGQPGLNIRKILLSEVEDIRATEVNGEAVLTFTPLRVSGSALEPLRAIGEEESWYCDGTFAGTTNLAVSTITIPVEREERVVDLLREYINSYCHQ